MATRRDIEAHYDAHDAIILKILDPRYLTYSTAHWEETDDLDTAQEAKFDYIAGQLQLGKRRRVLEVGSGWGSFASYCHRRFPEVEVVGLTLSTTQKRHVDAQGWSNFSCVLSDWRDYETDRPFDAIVAIESFEHYASMADRRAQRQVEVYRAFFEACRRLARPEAPLYVQSAVVRAEPDDLQGVKDARFILEKVFPGSALPTLSSVQMAAHPHYEFERLNLRGSHMKRTLEAWKGNLWARRDEILAEHGSTAFDFFDLYFDACARRFGIGHVDMLQLTLTPTRLV